MMVIEEEPRIRVMEGDWSVEAAAREIVESGEQEDPFYVMDLGEVAARYQRWKELMPRVEPFYAVKCNDDKVLVRTLAALGAGFDCASRNEIELVTGLGVAPERIIFANPAKMASHIRHASAVGVDTMTFDSEPELIKIKQYMPHAQLVLRIRCDATTAQRPLGIKFGCDPSADAPRLLKLAAVLGLEVVGTSFHVGSGVSETAVYARGIQYCRALFTLAATLGHARMRLVDIGGGFPGSTNSSIKEVSLVINEALETHFPERGVRVIAEPGRYFAAAAYSLAVMIHAKREIVSKGDAGEEQTETMYFMNDGIYGSFDCVMYSNQQVEATTLYPTSDKPLPCSLWGPTCDSLDCVLPRTALPPLPVGSWLLFRDMGAYTLPMATAFNGFPLPRVTTLVDHHVWAVLKTVWPLSECQWEPQRGRVPPPQAPPASPQEHRAVFVECALNTAGEALSYGELAQYAVSLSVALSELGVRGETVAVAGEPRVNFMPTALAVILAGAAYSPLELDCGTAILTHKLNLSRPKYVICSHLFWEAYSDVLKKLDFIKTIINFDDVGDVKLSIPTLTSRRVDVTTFEPAVVRGETDVAMVVYSSGTTGLSKGVELTHLNCLAQVNRSNSTKTLSYYQTGYLTSEVCSYYNILMIFCFLCTGIKVIYSEQLDLKTIQDYQVNIMITVPGGVEDMAKAERAEAWDLSTLKAVGSSGSHLHPSTIKLFKERYPSAKLLQLYGATEVGAIAMKEITSTHTECTPVGTVLPGVSLKVVDVQTRVTLGPNQRGEICVKSPCMMKGYLGISSPYLDDHGFFPTGDLGYFDDNKLVYLVDRLKDVIFYDGYQISPREVETVLKYHPAVREAAVVGQPAGAAGELVTAFVVLQPGAKVTEAELVDYMAREVSSYMQLRGGVRFVEELPRNSLQKLLRQRLRELLVLETK